MTLASAVIIHIGFQDHQDTWSCNIPEIHIRSSEHITAEYFTLETRLQDEVVNICLILIPVLTLDDGEGIQRHLTPPYCSNLPIEI